MDEEHKRELDQEERDEINKEPMYIWIEENKEDMRGDFLETFTHEQLKRHILNLRNFSLKTNEFFEEWEDDFNTYCKEQFNLAMQVD